MLAFATVHDEALWVKYLWWSEWETHNLNKNIHFLIFEKTSALLPPTFHRHSHILPPPTNFACQSFPSAVLWPNKTKLLIREWLWCLRLKEAFDTRTAVQTCSQSLPDIRGMCWCTHYNEVIKISIHHISTASTNKKNFVTKQCSS